MPYRDRPLRVLTYTTLFPSTVQPLWGHFVWERMRNLLPAIELTVVAPVPFFPPLRFNPRWYEFARVPRFEHWNGVPVHHPRYLVIPKLGMQTHGVAMWLGSRPLVDRLRASDFDLIDAHYIYPDCFAALQIARRLRKPLVVSARGTDINLFSRFATIRPMLRSVLRRADACIAVATALKEVMVELGCLPAKVSVIGNGVDAVKFAPADRTGARTALDLPLNRRIVLSVGHLIERKGHHLLIDSVARLRARMPDLLLVIVGEGEYRGVLERRIRELELSEHVHLKGAQPHASLARWYAAADLFCLASSREGWANVLLEAMACGVPVVATSIWGTPEVVTSERFGLLTARDPRALAAAIEDALSRTWDHAAIRTHAAAHGWDTVAQRVLAVYEDVLQR